MCAVVLSGAFAASIPAATTVAAAGPFTCAPGFYQVIAGQLKLLNPVTATYTSIGSTQPQYNAMGYNVLDNYLYALSTLAATQGDLLRIADDGSVTNLGLPAGLPSGSYVAGDFDNAGNLIIRSTATTWYSIDVSTNVATKLTITGAADTGNDLVWISGVMYLLNNATLYAVDLSTDIATSTTVSGVVSGAFGAAWSDNPNELYFSDNNTGHIYRITGFTTASPTGTLELTGTVTSNNDGAACKNADSPFDLPTANDDSYTATSDTTLNVGAPSGVLANDVGTGLTTIAGTGPSHGTLTLNPDGSFSYTPTAGFFGTDTFTYSVQDQFGRDSASAATVTITVNLPAAPAAIDDTYTTTADTALNEGAGGGVLANDSGTGITVTGNTSPSHGTLSVNPDGSFLYTPTSGYSGPDSFDYTITDAFSRTSSATASLTVNPVAANVSASGTGPAPINVTPPAPIGVGAFTYTLVTTPPGADGVATMDPSTGAITFTPAAGFHGTVPTFTYAVTDAASDVSAPATIDLTVGEPAAPAADPDTYSTTANTAVNQLAAGGLLTNDTGTGIAVSGNTNPANGTVTVNSDGSFVYTPTTGYSGPDSFDYTITDAYGRTSSATATLTVNPIAQDVTGSGPGPGAINVTPPTPIGVGPFVYTLVTTPPALDGTATIDGITGVITFTPAAGFHGTVPTFTYTVTDAASDVSAPATIDLTVGTPTPPVAHNVSGTTPAGQALTLTPTAPTGTGPFTFALATTPSASVGVATIDPSTGAITFTPANGFSGIVPTFTYTATDSYSQVSAPANVSIDVTPLSKPASGTGPAGKPITVQPPPPVGTGPFTYTLVPGSLPPAADGTVTIDPTTGAVTFAPAPGFTGTVSVQYTVTDSDGLTSPPSTVTFDVAGTTTTTVPGTGAVETPMIAGLMLLVLGLLLVGLAIGLVARRRGPEFPGAA
jgi:large repetitive protein